MHRKVRAKPKIDELLSKCVGKNVEYNFPIDKSSIATIQIILLKYFDSFYLLYKRAVPVYMMYLIYLCIPQATRRTARRCWGRRCRLAWAAITRAPASAWRG